MRKLILLVGTALLITGCGGDGLTEEESACRNLADAFGDLCERCDPGTFYECYDIIVNAVEGCSNVKEIRDEDELFNQCIPWLRAEDCANIVEGWELDGSCVGQLMI